MNDDITADIVRTLADRILQKRDLAVKARAASGIESQWLQAEALFDGEDVATGNVGSVTDVATGNYAVAKSNSVKRSKVVVNIIRGRCEQTEGRYSDIQLPVDNKNWGLTITPDPELSLQSKDKTPLVRNGEPVVKDGKAITLSDLAKNEMRIAQDKMKGMERKIDDYLVECGFNGECRKVVGDAIRKGTGILKGPSVIKRINKVWSGTEGGYRLKIVEQRKPFSYRVDPWNVFPDPDCGDDIARAGYLWERDFVLPKTLRNLIGVDGYIGSQIQKVLSSKPTRTMVAQTKRGMETYKDSEDYQTYEKWEYHGDLTSEELSILGCECDVVGTISACVVFVDDKPIKAVLNLLDTGGLPYDFFQWTKVSGAIWGIGHPDVLIWQQRIITAAWRAMMDNAGDSAGANVVIGEGIAPQDGKWELVGKKLWRYTGDMMDVRNAFAQFQLTNNQQALQQIIELALRFCDIETALPMAFAGEQVGPAETLGAVELKIDSSNVGLRGRVKRWDDQITRPHLTRYYNWEMQYGEDDEIKGDYNVDPRGVSVLLEKEKTTQAILQVLSLRQDPLFSDLIDGEKALKQLMANQNIDILKSEEEKTIVEGGEGQSPQEAIDPRIAGASQVAQMRIEGDMQKEQLRQKGDQQKFQAETAIEIEKIKEARAENERARQHELQLAAMQRDVKMLELANKGNITLEQIKAGLASTSMKLNVQRELSDRSREVITPPNEPAGLAKPGRSFEQ